MGLRMRKSIQICKGVRLNFGTSGASLSFGTKGLRHTIHTSGRRTTSVGIPGTGISYVKTHGKKKQKATQPNQNQQNKQNQPYHNRQEQPYQNSQNLNAAGQATNQVEEYNNLVATLTGLHKMCDETIDWQDIKNRQEPFNSGLIGPKQVKAIEELNAYRPGFLERLNSKEKRQELERAVQQAKEEDLEDYENWTKLMLLADKVLSGDAEAYLEVIDQMNPLEDLIQFGSDFEFGADNASAIEVEFTVKPADVVPDYSISLTKKRKITEKELTKTAYYDLVQNFVCSCTIRIARDIFALLPVKTVVVHAVENSINTATGRQEDMTILSVLFERDVFNGLNFDYIDPSDAMNNFMHYMKFQKTTGFKPVVRVEDF